ncbi:hypothetical protein [Listeria seeligeri]|nr:hypothetical protein [Listeria seeligeri]
MSLFVVLSFYKDAPELDVFSVKNMHVTKLSVPVKTGKIHE